MKKFFSVIAIALMATMIFAGCNDTTATTSDTTSATSSNQAVIEGNEVQASDYEKTFEGFVQYMTDCKYIKGEGEDLTAAAIGAKQGKRFIISAGTSKIYIELYEFDANAAETSDKAKQTIENARKDGTFTLFENTETETQNTLAAVSEDGRFLMLYTDTSTNEKNIAAKNGAAETVKEFSK